MKLQREIENLNEKEKKLNLALTKLRELNFKNPDIKNIENLTQQKNLASLLYHQGFYIYLYSFLYLLN